MKSGVTPEVYFAQHLASNDNKIRLRAIKKLRTWFLTRSRGGRDFTEEDMLKIWKGLYYCMWMCDKPLNQENLADNISQLLHSFVKPHMTLLFIDTFFQSISKEWFGIDRFRIEKFMLLVRRFLYQCFCFVSQRSWKNNSINALLDVLKGHAINPKPDSTPSGLKLHVVDIYLEELAKAGGCNLTPKKLLKFLKPYVMFLLKSEDSIQLTAIVKGIFHSLIWQKFNEDDDDDDDDNETEDEPVVTFQVDYDAIADMLLKTTATQKIKSKNLITVYKLVAKLRATANGEFPFENVESEDDPDEKEQKAFDVNASAKMLLEDDLKISEERRERLKEIRKKKKQRKDGSEESGSDIDDLQLDDYQSFMEFKESAPSRKRRKPNVKGKAKKGTETKMKGKKSSQMTEMKTKRKKVTFKGDDNKSTKKKTFAKPIGSKKHMKSGKSVGRKSPKSTKNFGGKKSFGLRQKKK